jgi:hypothetical protein
MRRAAELYNIPFSTLNDKFHGRHDKAVGPPTVLSASTEAYIVETLQCMAEIGYGLGRAETISFVQGYLEKTNQSHLFSNGKPSKDWYYGFIKRHKDKIKVSKAQNLPMNRAKATQPEVFDDFFAKLKEIYDKYELHDKPSNGFNCNETGFQCHQGKVKIVTKSNDKDPRKLTCNNSKAQYTVLVTTSADGSYLPLNVIYKGGRVFLKKVRHLHGYKLLIFDGHHSHISLALIQLAK